MVTRLLLGAALVAAVACNDDPPEPEVRGTAERPLPSSSPAVPNPESAEMTIDDVERVSIEELTDLMNQGQALVVDVRSPQSFIAAHIPGSISIPLTEMSVRMNELPRDRMIVTYCT
ncbi:MAG: hypothetical protein KY459_05875 [Acidobacteria bacterium]|nr:hypothetical protein [Acidobacteriota bacterium]